MILEATMAALSIVQGIGSISAGNAARREGRRLYRDAIARGEEDVIRYGRDLRQVVSAQRTMIASSGLDTDFGSAKDVRDQALKLGQMDIDTIRLNALREGRALLSGSTQYANQQFTSAAFSFAQAAPGVIRGVQGGVDAWSNWQVRRSNMTATSASRARFGMRGSGDFAATMPGSTRVGRPAAAPVGLGRP